MLTYTNSNKGFNCEVQKCSTNDGLCNSNTPVISSFEDKINVVVAIRKKPKKKKKRMSRGDKIFLQC